MITILKPRHPYVRNREHHPHPPPQPKGWHPKHNTFPTSPIGPDLDSTATGSFEITRHPTNDNEILLHDSRIADPSQTHNRLIAIMTKARLQKLKTFHNHTNDTSSLPEALVELTHRHTTINTTHNQTAKTKLHKHYELQPQHDLNGTWPIPNVIYDALNYSFNIQRVIHWNPTNLLLSAKTYIFHDPKDVCFRAFPTSKRRAREHPSPCRTTRPIHSNMSMNKHYTVPMHIDAPPLAATS